MTEAANRLELIDLHPTVESLEREVTAGLSKPQKTLPAKLFYDKRGSELFDEITRLPEYYPTRTEISILERYSGTMCAAMGHNFALIEYGSGSSTKVRILLDRCAEEATYMPVDISRDHLEESAQRLVDDFPALRVIAVCADYTRHFEIPHRTTFDRRVVFFPGSTVGNLEPASVSAFLAKTAADLQQDDVMIIGVDMKKDPAILHAAYNDSAGVTAEFNLNMLHRINEELGTDFCVERFEHQAFYDATKGRIEMHLRSLESQEVHLGDRTFGFAEGETIHTENSYKYDLDDFRTLVAGTGFEPVTVWTDRQRLFSIHLLRVS